MLLSYGNVINRQVNEKIIAIHEWLAEKPFPGYIESVPAYASVAIFYDTVLIKANQTNFKTAFEFVQQQVLQVVEKISDTISSEISNPIIIPVYYNGEDIDYVANVNHLTIEEVIKIHSAVIYRVFMIGFLPGFAYMGTVDERIITPRKEKPRLQVAAGSVGIAGAQTGIYPLDSPGGWQLIGTTPLQIFKANNVAPCLLKAGDNVQFVSIDKNEFEKLNVH